MIEPTRERTLTLIIAYKFVRAVVSVLGATTLVVLWAAGVTEQASRFVQNVHEHAASKLSLALSQLVLSGLAPRHLAVFIAALGLDATVLFLEGYSLLRAWWWGPWLVAAAAGVLLPFEVAAIAEHLSLARILLLVINLAIVIYLLGRTYRSHARR